MNLDLDDDVIDLARGLCVSYGSVVGEFPSVRLARAVVEAADSGANICSDASCDVVHPAISHAAYISAAHV